MVLVGDVKGRIAIIVDDMADTCGTLVKAADVVMEHGAREAIAIVTHGILSGNACEKLNGSKLKKLVVTNTVPHEEKKRKCERIETIDISPTVSPRLIYLCARNTYADCSVACGSVQADAQRRERVVLVQACALGLAVQGARAVHEQRHAQNDFEIDTLQPTILKPGVAHDRCRNASKDYHVAIHPLAISKYLVDSVRIVR